MAFKFRKVLAAACATTMITSAALASELRIDRLFVIGDSLSDAGSIAGVPITNDVDGGAQTYATALAERLGISGAPRFVRGTPNPGGTNYAQAGAQATGGAPLNVTQQVNLMLQNDRVRFNDSDLVVLWIGNNDVIGEAVSVAQQQQTPTRAIRNINIAADTVVRQVKRLKNAGATKVVVVTVPDIGKNTPGSRVSLLDPDTPGFAEVAPLVSANANAFNARVAAGIAGQDVAVINSDNLLSEILRNPGRYGFNADYSLDPAASRECAGSAPCIDDGTGLVFADNIHPSAQAHALFAQAADSGLIAATQTGAIPVATLGGIRQSSIGLENRLNLGAIYTTDEAGERAARGVGDFEVYGGGEVGFFESDAQQILPGFNAKTQVLKIAADVPVANKVVLGAGLSLDHGQVEFDDGRGGFDSRLLIGALFGVAEITRGVYVNGVLGYGVIDVYDIERNFDLGNSRESYSGSANGTYFSAKLGTGAMIPVGNGFLVNPSIGLTYEKVKVDGFEERASNNGVLARDFGSTEIDALRGTASLAGFYRPPSAQEWIIGLRASYEYEFNDDDLFVSSADQGGELAAQSAPRPDGKFGFLSGTVSHEFSEHSALTLGASTVIGLDGVDGYTASLIYKHKF